MGGNSRKQGNWWLTLGEGLLLALGVYLLATALIALLTVRAVLPEAGTFPALAVGCVLAAWAGAATKRTVALWRPREVAFPRRTSQERTISSKTPSPRWARPRLLTARISSGEALR